MISDRYVAVRDDAGPKSLSLNERSFLTGQGNSTKSVLRVDGRSHGDVRKVRLELGRWDNGAKCTVQWGLGTRVTALCSAELVPPSHDHPNEGMVGFLVDVSPMAGTQFRQANPVVTTTNASIQATRGPNFSDNNQRLLSNRILRCVERIVLVGGALDTEALVLMPGKWVWRFTVALTVLDDGGNVVDACTMAAISALRHYRKPKVEFSGNEQDQAGSPLLALPVLIPSSVQEATPLPLHHTPLSLTFALITADETSTGTSPTSAVTALVDPTDREEQCQFGSLTIATNIHSELCLLDYGGGCELLPSQLKGCWEIGEIAAKALCKQMEESLEQADYRARREKLKMLQGRQNDKGDTIPGTVPTGKLPFFSLGVDGGDTKAETEVGNTQNQIVQSQAEEAYREQALDYAKGHVASIVREDDTDDKQHSMKGGPQSLLSTMLKKAATSHAMEGESQVDTLEPDSHCCASVDDDPPTSVDKDEKVTRSKSNAPPSKAVLDEDDEEEPPVQLRSEFDDRVNLPSTAKVSVDASTTDLSMAIKKKKKKSKTKKK